ncbi:MAG TPA: carboxypeptidase-like regulatory domain-containing protein [Candidatus Sulfotelmatobacter sp.]|nr:carboxypeptidase-like regulatory domain-containing protein [Candidatus Sulfotelmatobacter sp.]
MHTPGIGFLASPSKFSRALIVVTLAAVFLTQFAAAQQTLGAITGTVTDPSGAVVFDANVKAVNIATNLEVAARTKANGGFVIPDLPAGTYRVTITKDGFKTETHTKILVSGNRTTTVDTTLVVGSISATVEVNAVPLMNQVDTTIGYVVDTNTIESTPLGTGSFTQLAILSPGVHADFLGGGGANTGLGNQAIFANGNRDTSNSFSLNGISTNNIFNGNSTSQVGENRFVLNTGENFGAGGTIQTSTSVYSAIGQALPTPPPDAIQEIAVNSSQYDATQGNNSGAHISVLTKSGTNAVHGSLWEQWQNSDMNATPYFYNAAGINPVTNKPYLPRPFLNRNAFGGTIGGPIIKDKLFFFGSYQGVRIADAQASTKDVTVPLGLTDDRSTQGIINMIQATYGTTITGSQINSAASQILNAKLPNGQYLMPSAQYNAKQAQTLGYDAVVQGPNTQARVNQGIAGIDYVLSSKDRLSAKYYIQSNPTSNPFGAVGSLLGFAQQLSAGSHVFSLSNSVVLSPNLTWEQHVGFTRLRAYAKTTKAFTAGSVGISLPGSATFPDVTIEASDPTINGGLEFGPSTSFGDGGMFQNQWEYGTSASWVKGKHIVSVGTTWDHTQLNIINNNNNTDTLDIQTFLDLVEGNLHGGNEFVGSASRYYRSNTIGTYISDNFKMKKNLTITAGLRWDIDGPLSEKYGKLTGFDSSKYSYVQCTVGGAPADPALTFYNGGTCDSGTDAITSSGLVIAGNNKTGATAGASNSLMKNHQWGFAPRIGISWSPMSKLTVRAGYGMYYDRGELFSYLSPSAGSGFNGPFGVTLAPPFVQPISVAQGATLEQPFGTTLPPPPPPTGAAFLSYLPNLQQTACGFPGCWPTGNLFGPFLFGGYDASNKLPYTQNWTLDLQYQASNNWMFEAGYVGNHGTHLVLPIPFNQPLIATSKNVVNGQTTSYGGTSPLFLDNEPVFTNEFSGNAPIRVPYPGYDMNSVLYKAEGTSNFDALQLQIHKRLSNGLQFTASYTWSHSLDEQSGLGLFFTGNNPLTPRANYASSDFDQTHVLLINYSYTIPKVVDSGAWGYVANGWTIGGQTVAQSGQPYSVYDFSGSVASLYFGTFNFIGNPIVPLVPGVTASQAAHPGANCAGFSTKICKLDSADFAPQFVAPGTNGVPPCDSSGCDFFESLYGNTGRNTFRGPFQVRFDMSLAKQFQIKERFQLRFEADAFNIFNHPDFDTPNNNVTFFPNFVGPPSIPPEGSLGIIQHTIGSPRFLQLSLHLAF